MEQEPANGRYGIFGLAVVRQARDTALSNEQITLFSASLGLAVDQLRYALCLLAAYSLAVVYKLLPVGLLKLVFDIGVGLLLSKFVLGSSWVHSFISALITLRS